MIISNLKTDGYGGQILGKISTYVFCKYHNLEYIYTPIIKCAHESFKDLDNFFQINKQNKDKNIENIKVIPEYNSKNFNLYDTIIKNNQNNYNIATCHWYINRETNKYYNNESINDLHL